MNERGINEGREKREAKGTRKRIDLFNLKFNFVKRDKNEVYRLNMNLYHKMRCQDEHLSYSFQSVTSVIHIFSMK